MEYYISYSPISKYSTNIDDVNNFNKVRNRSKGTLACPYFDEFNMEGDLSVGGSSSLCVYVLVFWLFMGEGKDVFSMRLICSLYCLPRVTLNKENDLLEYDQFSISFETSLCLGFEPIAGSTCKDFSRGNIHAAPITAEATTRASNRKCQCVHDIQQQL